MLLHGQSVLSVIGICSRPPFHACFLQERAARRFEAADKLRNVLRDAVLACRMSSAHP